MALSLSTPAATPAVAYAQRHRALGTTAAVAAAGSCSVSNGNNRGGGVARRASTASMLMSFFAGGSHTIDADAFCTPENPRVVRRRHSHASAAMPASYYIPDPTQQASPAVARLHSEMLELLMNSESADVEITVGADCRVFRAHRLILSTRCEYFKAELSRREQGVKANVFLPSIDSEAFAILLRYIYTANEFDEQDPAARLPFASASRRWQGTANWRLVLACHHAATSLLMPERAAAYVHAFCDHFSAAVRETTCRGLWQDQDDATAALAVVREMWLAASNYATGGGSALKSTDAARDLLVACTPDFWTAFGADLADGSCNQCETSDHDCQGGGQISAAGIKLLVHLDAATLVAVVNALPPALESALGRFRIAREWVFARRNTQYHLGLPQQQKEGLTTLLSTLGPDAFYDSSFDSEDADGLVAWNVVKQKGSAATLKLSVPGDDERFYESSNSPTSTLVGTPNRVTPDRTPTFGRRSVREVQSFRNLRTMVPRTPTPACRQSSSSDADFGNSKLNGHRTFDPLQIDFSDDSLEALEHLNLCGVSAADVLREVEPSGIFSTRRILELYRAAAAAEVAACDGGSLWMPVPLGFRGRRVSTAGAKIRGSGGSTRWTMVGGSEAVGAETQITYCTPIAITSSRGCSSNIGGAGGKFIWTVVPVCGTNGVGVGVSGDMPVSGGTNYNTSSSGSGMDSFYFGEELFCKLERRVSDFFGGNRRGSICHTLSTGFEEEAGDSEDNGDCDAASNCAFGDEKERRRSHRPSLQETTTARFVGDDGGWSVWSDGTLRVGKIFVGRLPKGVAFTRGSRVTLKLDMDARTLALDVDGVDCGVAFRNLPAVLYPSVVLSGSASVSVSQIRAY
ncbi:hypothetical protein HDU83_008135 [Entophlyctis luteolus]|nr:hypothetical protein HDU83_008135 [Entophlyctis luteolus]